MTFSERIGKNSPKSIIQREEVDQELRVGLWNVLDGFVGRRLVKNYLIHSGCQDLFRSLWFNHFKWPLDSIPDWGPKVLETIRAGFLNDWPWNEVYDFIEFVAQDGWGIFD